MALIETFKINSLRRYLSDSVMPLGILVIVAMMVLPLPTFLLDVFFSFNILLALLVLMIAIHSFRPLDFSSFPTLLLVATVLRLALNVAASSYVSPPCSIVIFRIVLSPATGYGLGCGRGHIRDCACTHKRCGKLYRVVLARDLKGRYKGREGDCAWDR